jgi:hypothetical protein
LYAIIKQHKQEECQIYTGISVLQLTLTKKIEIKNLGCATPNLGISHSSSRKQVYVRKFNPAVDAQHKRLHACAQRSTVFMFVVWK